MEPICKLLFKAPTVNSFAPYIWHLNVHIHAFKCCTFWQCDVNDGTSSLSGYPRGGAPVVVRCTAHCLSTMGASNALPLHALVSVRRAVFDALLLGGQLSTHAANCNLENRRTMHLHAITHCVGIVDFLSNVLFHVAHPLDSNYGGEGTVSWGMFPRDCEDTVARRRSLCKGEGVYRSRRPSPQR